MNKITILHADAEDPVARIAATLRDSLDVEILQVDALLPRLEVRAWPQMLHLAVEGDQGSTSGPGHVINRLFSLSGTGIGRYLKTNRRDERWLHVRLQNYFAGAMSLAYDQGVRGVSRSLLPLNAQWLSIQQALPSIRVPRFSYGFGYQRPDIAGLDNPMQKSVWSLFDWKEEHHLPAAEESRHQFFVERPFGKPLIAYFFGDSVGRSDQPGGAGTADDAELQRICMAARKAFRAEAGELLLYQQTQGLVFHAFSPYMRSAQVLPQFELDAIAWLQALSSARGSVLAC